MSTGVRHRRGLTVATAALCLFAIVAPSARATFPGRPGLVVFSKVELHGDGAEVSGGLFAIRPGQTQPRQMTSNPMDNDPSFAPSGKQLVFRRSGSSGGGIYVLNPNTGETKRVASHQSDLDPAFGPRGMIVFSRFVDGSSYDLSCEREAGRFGD